MRMLRRIADHVLLQTWWNGGESRPARVAEAEAVAMMESCPMFGGVALRDLDREDRIKRDTLAALFPGFCAVPDSARTLASLAIEIIRLLFLSGVPNGSMGSSSGCRRLGMPVFFALALGSFLRRDLKLR
jgi:hypothetical protein